MKNSAKYTQKMKKLLSGVKDGKAPDTVDRLRLMIRAILEEDAGIKQANEAYAGVEEEFINLNELRVAPVKDIMECLGRRFPRARIKAEVMTNALNSVFDRSNSLSMDYLEGRPKREIRKALREDLGLSLYSEAMVALYGFGGHAIPVDNLLLESLKLDDNIDPSTDMEDLQGFLERLVLSKDGIAAHEALRSYASHHYAKLEKVIQQRAQDDEKSRALVKANQPREPFLQTADEQMMAMERLDDDEAGPLPIEEEPVGLPPEKKAAIVKSKLEKLKATKAVKGKPVPKRGK